MTIHENIRRIRLEKHMTQEQVAKACGTVGAVIRAYELGKANPKPTTVAKIAKALSVTPAELYGVENDARISDETLAALAQIETGGNVDPNTADKIRLLNAFDKLSSTGRTEAIKRVEELSHLPWFAADEHKAAAHMDDMINGITAILKKNRPDATREIAAFTQYALNKYEKGLTESDNAPPRKPDAEDYLTY